MKIVTSKHPFTYQFDRKTKVEVSEKGTVVRDIVAHRLTQVFGQMVHVAEAPSTAAELPLTHEEKFRIAKEQAAKETEGQETVEGEEDGGAGDDEDGGVDEDFVNDDE